MTADNIALLNAVLTLALVLLTGVYVFLTHRLVVQTKETSRENAAIQTLQARLAYFPKLSCRTNWISDRIVVTISNPCDHPAYDVEVFAIHCYDENDIDIATFSVKYITEEGRRLGISPTEEGFYGVFNTMAYADFPGRKKVEVILDTPMMPPCFHILIQFKDVVSYNYAQTYWFFSDPPNDPHSYKLGSMRPSVPMPIPRIDRDWDNFSTFVMADKSNVEHHVDREFLDFFKASFPSGYLKNTTHGIEDRGRWHDL
ncbi:hypothetical protein [uncultured Azonexus sp.]|uniref:hypothetical protein n=1 Tax=uncultured Azonexus sp. TaxID=520307 RepID=UPI0026182044|nr:hypothetical protein [uncultured Azonexus sp.]